MNSIQISRRIIVSVACRLARQIAVSNWLGFSLSFFFFYSFVPHKRILKWQTFSPTDGEIVCVFENTSHSPTPRTDCRHLLACCSHSLGRFFFSLISLSLSLSLKTTITVQPPPQAQAPPRRVYKSLKCALNRVWRSRGELNSSVHKRWGRLKKCDG